MFIQFFFHIKLALGSSEFNALNLRSFLENCRKDKCVPNAILRKGKYLQSRNQKYQFHLRKNGNLVLTCGGRPIWTSLTVNDTVDFLHFNEEGTSLILHGKDNSTIWSTYSSGRGKELVLQDDGKLVLYTFCNKSIWEKGNNKKCQTGLVQSIYFRIYHYLFNVLLQEVVTDMCSTKYYCCLVLQKNGNYAPGF